MKYFKNVHARRLATGRSDLVRAVISEIANPYFPEIIHGFQTAAWDRGSTSFFATPNTTKPETKIHPAEADRSDVRGAAVMTSSIDKSMASEIIGAGIAWCSAT